MITDLQLDDKATWKQRFRAPIVAWTQIAPANRTRGLAVNNTSGKYQLYAWDVPSGELRQLTERPAGILFGALSGDGRYVYYLDDGQGTEQTSGHQNRKPSRLGIGIPGMMARMQQVGGNLDIHSGPNGTAVHATVPLG